jgi:hypothetical protein
MTGRNDAKPQKEPLSDTAPSVAPTHNSVITHLSLRDNIEKDKAELLKPILLDIGKRLERRQYGQYK